MQIRRAVGADAERLAALLAAYLREGYPGHVGATPAELRRDVLGAHLSRHPRQQVLLAERGAEAAGFVAWDVVYDMHWAMAGAQVADLYVAPSARGVGVALVLVAQLCAEVRAAGGSFVRGGAYDRASTRRFYGRLAVVAPSGETHLGGRAFRSLADLAGLPTRRILAALPPVAWNFEP